MAVLKKLRKRLWPGRTEREAEMVEPFLLPAGFATAREFYDVRPLTLAQMDEVWRLDQRCFVDGEAYSRDTFEFLLTSPDTLSYRAVTTGGLMVGFAMGVLEPDSTGHITTVGVAPEHRRRRIAQRMLEKMEDGFQRRSIRLIRLEVRSVNTGAQLLYEAAGYTIAQRLPRYYSNGGDGLLMLKSLDE